MSFRNFVLLVLADIVYILYSPSIIELFNSVSGSGVSYWFLGASFWMILGTLVFYTWRSAQATFTPQGQQQGSRRRRGGR